MKIIDILNKIANGEEVPNTFKYREYLFYYDEYNKCYFEEGHKNLFDILAFFKGWTLNEEIEMLEEENKIPEKLIISKINEILDYLKSKGE